MLLIAIVDAVRMHFITILLAAIENCKDFNVIKRLYSVDNVLHFRLPVMYDKVGKKTLTIAELPNFTSLSPWKRHRDKFDIP